MTTNDTKANATPGTTPSRLRVKSAVRAGDPIVSPRDPQSGLPTGQRMHKPFVFTK